LLSVSKGRKVYQSLQDIEAMEEGNSEALRIDRWLWFSRFFKTRGLAATAVSGGHAKINGERAKPGVKVRKGDIIELVRDKLPFKLTVIELPVRRGPASEARRCYAEDEAVALRRKQVQDSIRQDRRLMPTTKGKPDKHTRRKLREHNRQRSEADKKNPQ